MTITDVGDTVHSWSVRLRERLSRFVPETMTHYPFEVFVGIVSLFIGLPLVLGIARPESLTLLLPTFFYLAYAVILIVGGIAVLIALRKRNPQMLSSALALLGGGFTVYALALFAVAGLSAGGVACALFAFVAIMCFVRSLHFKRLIDITEGARRLRGDS